MAVAPLARRRAAVDRAVGVAVPVLDVEQRDRVARLEREIDAAIMQQNPPPLRGGRQPRVLFATQASSRPPVIVLFTTGFLEHGYRRFLERKLREEFGFEGSPVRIAVRVREKKKRR